jgi:hypothetical protein
VAAGRCYRLETDALVVTVRLTPRAARDAVDGVSTLSDGRPVAVARVRALPADGAANTALCDLLAKTLKVRKSAVTIVSGHTSRLKQARIEGDPAMLSEAIATWPEIA